MNHIDAKPRTRPPVQHHRDAMDADQHPALSDNPAHDDAKLDIGIDESFPASDPPANVQPGRGSEPAPSSGFNADQAPAPPPLDKP